MSREEKRVRESHEAGSNFRVCVFLLPFLWKRNYYPDCRSFSRLPSLFSLLRRTFRDSLRRTRQASGYKFSAAQSERNSRKYQPLCFASREPPITLTSQSSRRCPGRSLRIFQRAETRERVCYRVPRLSRPSCFMHGPLQIMRNPAGHIEIKVLTTAVVSFLPSLKRVLFGQNVGNILSVRLM